MPACLDCALREDGRVNIRCNVEMIDVGSQLRLRNEKIGDYVPG